MHPDHSSSHSTGYFGDYRLYFDEEIGLKRRLYETKVHCSDRRFNIVNMHYEFSLYLKNKEIGVGILPGISNE